MTVNKKIQVKMDVVKDDDSGYTYIPASRRPDGSWRKARRVKDGFVPQEEMPTYENKGVQWLKSKPSLPPGLSPPDSSSTTSTAGMSKSAKKNLKRKEKKKQQSDVKELGKSLEKVQIFAPNHSQSGAENIEANEQKEQFKHLRALRKKLKQIDDIKERIESGQLKNPEKGQLDKLTKREAVVSEIEELESELGDLS